MNARRRSPRTGLDDVLAYALTKPGAWLDHPWDEDHDVVKVGPRMFVSVGSVRTDEAFSIRHHDLDSREMWRGRYPDAIGPMRYMPSKPWSTVALARGIEEEDVLELIDESYLAVAGRLAKKDRPPGWDAGLTD